jgi:hypothetical protein
MNEPEAGSAKARAVELLDRYRASWNLMELRELLGLLIENLDPVARCGCPYNARRGECVPGCPERPAREWAEISEAEELAWSRAVGAPATQLEALSYGLVGWTLRERGRRARQTGAAILRGQTQRSLENRHRTAIVDRSDGDSGTVGSKG